MNYWTKIVHDEEIDRRFARNVCPKCQGTLKIADKKNKELHCQYCHLTILPDDFNITDRFK